ncbi:hypothetical protein ABZ990_03090 [Streptomyces sp. NPDC046203]|uniref:DUF6924 domain-containing protein n=1 Tax=Streptomyces sp. NPDC046203 TaxID=3154602 RepID=UPI0033E2966A
MGDGVEWPVDRDVDAALIVRTDYSDDRAWETVLAELRKLPEEWGDDYESYLHIVDDPAWAGVTPDWMLAMASSAGEQDHEVYLADRVTMTSTPLTLLALSLLSEDHAEDHEHFEEWAGLFRVTPPAVHEMNANLNIANLSFREFAETAREDPEGICRGSVF